MKGIPKTASECSCLNPSDEPHLTKLKSIAPDQHLVLLKYLSAPYPTYGHIAAELGWPIGTVRSRINRARTKIVQWRNKARADHEKATQGTATQEHQGADVGPSAGGVPSVEQG